MNHETVGRVRAEEGIPTPDEVIRDYVAENPGKSNREVADDLGVNRKTVDALAQNGENRQNGNAPSEPEPEPDDEDDTPAPSWEHAGHLHPAIRPRMAAKAIKTNP